MRDKVCLFETSSCVDPFKFFLISEQYGIPDEVDGIWGLAMGYSSIGMNAIERGYNQGDLFLDEIRLLGHITETSFSTHFTGRTG